MIDAHRMAPAWLILASLFLASCEEVKAIIDPARPAAPLAKITLNQFPDISVPAGAMMDVERSLVMGTRKAWIGRLSMKIARGSGSVYEFFSARMTEHGWRETSSMRSQVSVLTYLSGERVATVQIWEPWKGETKIDITVSSKGKPPRILTSQGREPPPFK